MRRGGPSSPPLLHFFYEPLRRSIAALRSPFVIFDRPLMPSLWASL